jgi:hypothetical protein
MLVCLEEVVIEPRCSPGSPGVEFIKGSSERKVEGTPEYVPTSPPMDWNTIADEVAAGPDGRDSLDKDSLEDLTMSWQYGIRWTEDRATRRNSQWEQASMYPACTFVIVIVFVFMFLLCGFMRGFEKGEARIVIELGVLKFDNRKRVG